MEPHVKKIRTIYGKTGIKPSMILKFFNASPDSSDINNNRQMLIYNWIMQHIISYKQSKILNMNISITNIEDWVLANNESVFSNSTAKTTVYECCTEGKDVNKTLQVEYYATDEIDALAYLNVYGGVYRNTLHNFQFKVKAGEFSEFLTTFANKINQGE